MSRNTPISETRVKVTLLYDDWKDLIHFITGDLQNMEDSPVKAQMTDICETIRLRCAAARATKGGH